MNDLYLIEIEAAQSNNNSAVKKPPSITLFTHLRTGKCEKKRVSKAHLPSRLPAVKLSKMIIQSALQSLSCVTETVGYAVDFNF